MLHVPHSSAKNLNYQIIYAYNAQMSGLQSFSQALNRIIQHIPYSLGIIAILWAIQIVNSAIGKRFNIFGIIPRKSVGLPGIVLSPLLHGNFAHLFTNSIPMFVLMTFILVAGQPTFWCATISIVLISGSLTWCFGRSAIHIGASSLVMGYFSYLLVNTYYHPSLLSVALVLVVLYYFGGLVLSLFPTDIKTSWEGHVFGFIAGLITPFICGHFV